MGDLKESALTQQSDCKWVRALDANGNSIRISKEDLAAVVGELIGTVTSEKNGLMPAKFTNDKGFFTLPIASAYSGDMNDLYKYVNEGITILNVASITNGVQNYSIAIHIQRSTRLNNTTSQYIIQIQPDNLNKLKFRTGTGNGTGISYTDWVSL